MLFKDEMIKPIINSIKTETRRAWNRCWLKRIISIKQRQIIREIVYLYR